MQIPIEIGFLGFGRGMPWRTSIWLVSSGKGLIFTDLKGESRVCLGLWILDTAAMVAPWEAICMMPWGSDLEAGNGTVTGGGSVCVGTSLHCRDILLNAKNEV